MNDLDDFDLWIDFDGPEPEPIRPLLDALRATPAATRASVEEGVRRFSAWLATVPLPAPVASAPASPAPPEPTPPEKRAAGMVQAPETRWRRGDTTPSADDAIAKAVAALRATGSTAGAGSAPFPSLTLEQYASLHAELAIWPERLAEIPVRYNVLGEAARRALDEHWQKRFAEHLADHDAFEKALATYTSYLRTVRMAP